CTATDAHGNAATSFFDVFVVDTTPPTIDSHADVTAEATSSAGAVVMYESPATHDAVDGDQSANCTPAAGSVFALGTTRVYCTATDAHGNAATSFFDVFVTRISSCGFDDDLKDWTVDETGGSPTGKGTVVVAGGDAILREGDS